MRLNTNKTIELNSLIILKDIPLQPPVAITTIEKISD